ncbi:hypothetical protein [Paraclostridium bifermentans]|uniref:hypothetical protein n=1 Tax=Paraclostridium bifermentans TaxID=1490 RepID=UPI0022E23DCC|nr:hypothetical protein [Paraclostridium bifermentans]
MEEYVKNKKDMKFSSLDSLESVVNVINDAEQALGDKTRTIKDSAIPEVVAGAVGAGVGGAASFGALYGLGVVGLSGPGIMSGLAAAGGIVGGGAAAGVLVLAAPVAILAGVGVGTAAAMKRKQLKQEKERLYKEAVKKQNAIIKSLEKEANESKERIEYLEGLNILLQTAIRDLKSDLGY